MARVEGRLKELWDYYCDEADDSNSMTGCILRYFIKNPKRSVSESNLSSRVRWGSGKGIKPVTAWTCLTQLVREGSSVLLRRFNHTTREFEYWINPKFIEHFRARQRAKRKKK